MQSGPTLVTVGHFCSRENILIIYYSIADSGQGLPQFIESFELLQTRLWLFISKLGFTPLTQALQKAHFVGPFTPLC